MKTLEDLNRESKRLAEMAEENCRYVISLLDQFDSKAAKELLRELEGKYGNFG